MALSSQPSLSPEQQRLMSATYEFGEYTDGVAGILFKKPGDTVNIGDVMDVYGLGYQTAMITTANGVQHYVFPLEETDANGSIFWGVLTDRDPQGSNPDREMQYGFVDNNGRLPVTIGEPIVLGAYEGRTKVSGSPVERVIIFCDRVSKVVSPKYIGKESPLSRFEISKSILETAERGRRIFEAAGRVAVREAITD